MKDFDIAKYLREHQMGSYGILNHYVDLKPLKEEEAANPVGFKIGDQLKPKITKVILKITGIGKEEVTAKVIQSKDPWLANDSLIKINKKDIGPGKAYSVINKGEVTEDVTPEEVAEIPYEGPEHKLTGNGEGDEFEQAEVVSEASYQIDWEDLEDTDLAGSGMEIEIDDFIDRTEKTIQFELTNDSTVSQLNRENPRQAAAQIRSLIKKLWLEKIRNWKG